MSWQNIQNTESQKKQANKKYPNQPTNNKNQSSANILYIACIFFLTR